MMLRRETCWAIALGLWFATGTVGAPTETGSDTIASNAETIIEILVERGSTESDARLVIGHLSTDDIRVFADNPEMLQHAGDANDAASAALLVLLVLLLIAAAASA